MSKTELLPELKGKKQIENQFVTDAKIRIKSILSERLGAAAFKVVTLTEYDSYFAQIGQFRATEMSRVYKNPTMAAIKFESG